MARQVFEGGSDVSQRDLPDGFKQDIKALVAYAVAVGWRLTVTSNAGMTIVSPDENKKLHFSNRRSSGPLQRLRRTIDKYADPGRVEYMHNIMSSDLTDDQYIEMMSPLLADSNIEFATPDQEEEPVKKRKAAPRPAAAKKVEEIDKKATEQATPERTLVSEKPMLARAHEGRAYESRVAIERTWSDGTVDYKCTLCDYTGERLSVRGHWQKHVRAGEVEASGPGGRGPEFQADVPLAAKYSPRMSRVEALAEWLASAYVPGEEPDFTLLARDALTWVHEQSAQGTALAAEREELSSDDILNRIRVLLDQGQYVKQREQIDKLSQELSTLRSDYLLMDAQRELAESKLQAFRELVIEEFGGGMDEEQAG